MEKARFKKISDWWGEYDCSSNRNMPKDFVWVPKESSEECKATVYVDSYILSWGAKDPNPKKIGWLLESPQMNKGTIKSILSDLDTVKEHYETIFTCMDSLVALGDPFKYCISNAAPWIWPQNRMIYPKTKLVSMIASDKGWLNGHKNRLEWVDKLKDKVDLYGRGRQLQLNDKEDGIRDYMFSVSIENDDSDTYFTEKLTDNFVMGTVPVYWGSRKVVERYFDSRGVIFLEDDPTLSTVTAGTYEAMKPYIEINFKLAMELPLAEDYMYDNYLKNL